MAASDYLESDHGRQAVVSDRSQTQPTRVHIRGDCAAKVTAEKLVRLDEPHLLDRHRLTHGERADLAGVSGVVGGSRGRSAHQSRLSMNALCSVSSNAFSVVVRTFPIALSANTYFAIALIVWSFEGHEDLLAYDPELLHHFPGLGGRFGMSLTPRTR